MFQSTKSASSANLYGFYHTYDMSDSLTPPPVPSPPSEDPGSRLGSPPPQEGARPFREETDPPPVAAQPVTVEVMPGGRRPMPGSAPTLFPPAKIVESSPPPERKPFGNLEKPGPNPEPPSPYRTDERNRVPAPKPAPVPMEFGAKNATRKRGWMPRVTPLTVAGAALLVLTVGAGIQVMLPRIFGSPGPSIDEQIQIARASAVETGKSLEEPTGPVVMRAISVSERPPIPAPVVDMPADANPAALYTLLHFLKARTAEDCLPYVRNPGASRDKIERYFSARREPPRLLKLALRRQSPIAHSALIACLFRVATWDNNRGFPVVVEQTSKGFKIDWDTYIQFKDDTLGKFLETPSEGATGRFAVILSRRHYFGDAIPRNANLDAFLLRSPLDQNTNAFVFSDPESAEGKATLEAFLWDRHYFPVVDVEWKGSDDGPPHLELVRVVRRGWRG